jgi:hypothetical protein
MRCSTFLGEKDVENQEVQMNDIQRSICEKFNLTVRQKGEEFTVTDRDPILVKRKEKLPRHVGTDLNAMIAKARAEQDARNGVEPEPPVVDVEPEIIEVVETAPTPTRRAALTPEEMTATRQTLTNVILDNTGMKVRKPKIVKERKHRDNRLARAFRAIIENPDKTVAQQAVIADVTEAMLGYYEIQLRSVYKIICEKHGDDVIPPLPALNK